MARHFLGLYLLIVLTLAAVSWGQDRLLQIYGTQGAAEDKFLALAMTILENQLRGVPPENWKPVVAALLLETGTPDALRRSFQQSQQVAECERVWSGQDTNSGGRAAL